MEQHTTKLGEIKLVSKYYPVGNYSYPRKDDGTLRNTIRTVNDRISLGSEGSEGPAPGLVDDKSDSEVSQEDDYQFHAHSTDPLDPFWSPDQFHPGKTTSPTPPKKQYPSLLPSPQHRRQRSGASDGPISPSWPLPDTVPLERSSRKAAASYSAFPSNRPPPPPAPLSKPYAVPPRPPRPSHLVLTPCLEQPASVPSAFATTAGLTSPNRMQRPKTSAGEQSPSRHRITKSLDERPVNISGLGRRKSSAHLGRAKSPTRAPRAPRSYKSTSQLAGRKLAEQSYFDFDDSDSEESPTTNKSFFKFHKRSESDQRNAEKSKPRHRTDTLPVSPTIAQGEQSHTGKRRQGDVLGRMLGRLSR